VAVAPPRVEAAVVVDGVLDEPVWSRAALLTGFSQFAPKDGIAAADSTEVLVWYSPTAVHFGIRAFEPHGEVRTTLAERDKIGSDDYVQLLLDTFKDGRQAMVFVVNPLGVQADGVLKEVVRTSKKFQPSITSRVKIMGNLNIAEKRMPQDGRIRIKVAGRDIDLRLSTIPTAHGERIVMRLLDKGSTTLDLKTLGMRKDVVDAMAQLVHRPNGILLCTGPTGSGKTTTLYSALTSINNPDINILTIEDPVEYQLEGIGQMQVNPKIDFTFAKGLRATLRQDPDVVLVGEIRDLETAEIAVQAALTGHLVLSTVHTNDAASTYTRMVDMGVEPFLLSSSIVGILAQRLIRVLCRDCRVPHLPTDLELEQLGLKRSDARLKTATFYRAKGCPQCSMSGYAGRSGLHELLIPNEEIKRLVVSKSDAGAIKRAAVAGGMATLRDDGAQKCMAGFTTVEEVMRIANADEEE